MNSIIKITTCKSHLRRSEYIAYSGLLMAQSRVSNISSITPMFEKLASTLENSSTLFCEAEGLV